MLINSIKLFCQYVCVCVCITSISHSAACVAPMEPRCPPLFSPINMCFVLYCLINLLLHEITFIFVCIYHVFSPHPFILQFFFLLSSVLMISLSLSLSLCLSSSRVAQSLLVPGKSPSKYGRRGSAIGIGTVEEVHV